MSLVRDCYCKEVDSEGLQKFPGVLLWSILKSSLYRGLTSINVILKYT